MVIEISAPPYLPPVTMTMRSILLLLAFMSSVMLCSGCATMKIPPLLPGAGLDADVGVELQGSESARAFQQVREAKDQNAIVLHVPGDDEAIRVLPLPQDGQSVFVSDLLRQSGVQKKLRRVAPVLYRASSESINGIRMEVGMTEGGKSVRPESDYALQAGDRLEVREAPPAPLNGIFSSIMGL